MTMPMPQPNLFGEMTYPPMSYHERVASLMERYPETRNDDNELLFWYWVEFDGLAGVLGDEAALEAFHAFLVSDKTTCPETVRRRRAEIQKLGTGYGSLQPDPQEADYRRKRARAGAPTGRR